MYKEPLHIVRGKGAWLYDNDGNAYLDCVNNVAHVGHSNATVTADALPCRSYVSISHSAHLRV